MGCLQRRAQGPHAALPPDPEEDRPSWGLGGTHPGRQGLQSSVRLSDLGEDKAGISQPVPSSGRQGWAGLGDLCRGRLPQELQALQAALPTIGPQGAGRQSQAW